MSTFTSWHLEALHFVHVSDVVREALNPNKPASEPEDQESEDSKHPGEKMDMAESQSDGLLLSEERLLPTSDSHMEYDDLPALQEAGPTETPAYQVEVGVSHLAGGGDNKNHCGPPDTRWLIQLAHIATGPQSPLLQQPQRPSPLHVFSTSCGLHSYARPPLPPAPPPPPPSVRAGLLPAPPAGRGRGQRCTRKSSEVSSRRPPSDDEDMGWSHSWPPTAWHCFLKGSRVRFHGRPGGAWQDVEDLVSAEEGSAAQQGAAPQGYGSDGLRLTDHSEVTSSDRSVLQLTFDPGAFGHATLTAQCPLDHPFYVKHKGWSSFHPSLTVVHYGIPCYELERGDVCLPPGHRDAVRTDASLVFNTFRSYDFTPLDSSAVYVLSSMARRRRTSQSSGGAVSPDREAPQEAQSPGPSHSPRQQPIQSPPSGQPGSSNATRCKRPMNAFMLFAKKFRVEYTQMHPGKDNRAISVLLGERWKRLRGDERRVFTVEAKALADQQKILDPDCWKRRRTSSGGQGN